ncbi:hypothetical protein PIB30_070852 [Stylosanthes scabra]|uniref:Aminotransferase-like plant mobile domain-containing protein n=1 Tax=Stylosanthes scabra TaxID=79078 RepID=A0ABU6TPF9_9FABA|nr:hypothetical protein [Stylosanthes scabra]
MGCQVSIFEVRRCAFGDKLYGIVESYGQEGVDVEMNSPRSPEIGLWDSRSNRVPASYLPGATCLFETQVLRGDVSFFFADVSEVLSYFEKWRRRNLDKMFVSLKCFLWPRGSCMAAEGDYVLEAAGPSDRLPFRAQEDRIHFLWVYSELFTCLGVWLPFTDFQMEVLSRCRVAASQLHLNGWGFLRTFERVCLHFGFRPSWRVFLYTYQLHAPPLGRGFMSFRAYQGRKLFDSFEESIQQFKWHYFKVLPFPGKRPFWLDDEGAPFPWVYWNAEVGDFCVTALDPLETLAFEFLQSLPAGLGKKSNFKCRWILDHSNADVGAFLALSDSLLKDMEKQSHFDRLMQRMKEAEGAGPRSILPSSKAQTTSSGVSASGPVSAPSIPLVSSSGASKATGKSTSADLRQKRRKRKVSEASAEEAALGGDSAWKHKVNPIDRAFPPDYNFRAALDAGLTNAPIRKILEPLVPEQLLGTAQFLACQLTACLQVAVENTFAAKVQLEKELAAAREQVDVLTAERDSALAAPLLHEDQVFD